MQGVWSGVTHLAANEPWIVALVAFVIVVGMVRSARVAIHSGPRADVRPFTRRDQAVFLGITDKKRKYNNVYKGDSAHYLYLKEQPI